MIKLNRWESQLVYLAKNFPLHKDNNQIDYKDALKILWGERYMLYPEHVDLGYVSGTLVDLVQKVVPNFQMKEFLGKLAPTQYGETKYTDNQSYAERICWVCLYNYLSILKIREREKDENDEWFDIVGLMPYEPELLIVEEEDETS